jgi:hypothetical protein
LALARAISISSSYAWSISRREQDVEDRGVHGLESACCATAARSGASNAAAAMGRTRAGSSSFVDPGLQKVGSGRRAQRMKNARITRRPVKVGEAGSGNRRLHPARYLHASFTPPGEPPVHMSKPKILVVEDDTDIRELLQYSFPAKAAR